MTLTQSLNQIETWLKANFSTAYTALRPGLDAARFQAQMAGVPFSVPADLAEVYAWHDGMADGLPIFAHYSFYPLAIALAEYLQNRTVSEQLEAQHGFMSWRPERWPVLGFEGEYFVIDLQSGAIWYHFLEDDPCYAFDSLEQIFACIATAMHQGLSQALPDGRLALDGPGFEMLRRQAVSASGQASRLPLEQETLA
ncbi:MAG: hypothetical protein ACAI44_35255 [Candidatus Sericytochromatia bacterium]